jgi:putative heme-binding domain-containing protein
VRCANAGVFRYEPRTQKFSVYVPFGFANPHGHVFDRWGQDIVVDGTGSQPYHAALFSGHLDFPRKHASPPQVYQQRTRPCPGMEYLSSRHFPESMQGNLLVANVIGFQGILQYKIADNGASFVGTEVEPILSSTDPNFRPTDLKIGPDGAIYFVDWHNPIIGHMQHNLRDPSRDREHGRIYRVTHEGQPLLKSPKIAGESIEKLLDLLKSPEARVRYRVRIELGARKTDDVIPAAKQWLAKLDSYNPEFAQHVLEALWLHQSHNVVDVELLLRVLNSREFRARAAATRVLCYWRDRVPDALDVLRRMADDSHPRVRLEAIRAASFFTDPEAVEVVLIAAEKPTDVYLDFVRGETLKALDPYVKQAIAAKKPIHFTSPSGKRYFARTVSTEDLILMERDETVNTELLSRKGIRDDLRREAASAIAKSNRTDVAGAFLHAVQTFGAGSDRPALEDSVVIDLMRLMIDCGARALHPHRAELEKLSQEASRPITREMAFVALAEADGGTEKIWTLATRRALGMRDLLSAMPLIRDPGHRASLYPKVAPLLDGLPKELADESGQSILGRFVRIELPGKQRTLTLAEIEVLSAGRNVAIQGKASQINTAYGADARRAIDRNTSGVFGDGGQTHTKEGTDSPWWEVDLGTEMPIDSVIIHNRTEGNFGARLNGFTVKVLDATRNPVFEKTEQPAPKTNAVIQVGGESSEIVLRHGAMRALTSVRGKEANTFHALMRFIESEPDRSAVLQALSQIPVSNWPKDQAKPFLEKLLTFVRGIPEQERSKPTVREALQLADTAASQLPAAEAKLAREEIGNLGVRTIRIGTVPEQMIYDQERIVVKAGRPLEIELVNTDMMPHNLVLIEPGSLEEIGNMAEATATAPDAAARNYVPQSRHVVLATKLLQPRESQVLSFAAPTRPGIYPYVCTYPGHWRRMFGALVVVDDVDEYLADGDSYLNKHRIAALDPLLKTIRTRTEWRFDDLAPTLDGLKNGRSYANGKQMFQVASCVSCHKLNGVGLEIGPDLAKLEPKLQTPTEVLRELIDPSQRINEKFQTQVFGTHAGKVITGLVTEETPDTVKVVENPLVKADPILLKKSDIAERAKSATSIMPKGLLDKLTREEILDLIAYVVAAGDPKHALFQGGHGTGRHSGH